MMVIVNDVDIHGDDAVHDECDDDGADDDDADADYVNYCEPGSWS